MPFNIGKCKVLHIGEKNVKIDYSLMGTTIPSAGEEKDLGVFSQINSSPLLTVIRSVKQQMKLLV